MQLQKKNFYYQGKQVTTLKAQLAVFPAFM
jgi:hypothetical protein